MSMFKLGRIFGGGTKKVEFVTAHTRGKHVLDLGVVAHDPATYELDNWLHKHVATSSASCLGIDVLGEGIAELAARGFTVEHGDAQRFDLGRDFDIVVAGDVLEHLHDFNGFFDSVRSHLRSGGQLVVTTPNPWFLVRVLQALLRGKAYVNAEHTVWFCFDTLTEMFDRHGFEVNSMVYGSSENWLYRLLFLPKVMRHTSLFAVVSPQDPQ